MNTLIVAVRLPETLGRKLAELADATGRPRSEIIRYLLATAESGDIPTSWFATAPAERVARGAGNANTMTVPGGSDD
jgi:predicted DNA-binding protein